MRATARASQKRSIFGSPAPGKRQDRARFELADALIDRVRRRDVVVAHVTGDRGAIDCRGPSRMLPQRLEFGAEEKKVAEFRPI